MINKNIFEFPINYTNAIPKIAMGWGAYETVGDECKAAGMKKALLVTSGLKGTGIIDEMKGVINYAGVSTEVYDKVTTNPKGHQVMEAYKVFKEAECDGVVAIGGGSSIDVGKGVRVVAANDGKEVTDFAVFLDPPWMETLKKMKPCTIPQVSVTTTSGTGAEVSSFATLSDTKTRMKVLVSAPNIHSNIAIVDPLLARSQSREMAAWSGFDAMAHAVEPFITKVQSPYVSGMLLHIMELVHKNIREFTYNRMNNTACEKMCLASTMGGIAIAFGAGAGLVHGLGHQISAVTDCHHGRINAIVMLAAERYNQPAIMEKLAAMTRSLGIDTTGMTEREAAERWFVEIEQLLKDLNIMPGQLNKQFGLKEADFDHIVKVYSNDFCSQGNPRNFNYDEVVGVLKGAL